MKKIMLRIKMWAVAVRAKLEDFRPRGGPKKDSVNTVEIPPYGPSVKIPDEHREHFETDQTIEFTPEELAILDSVSPSEVVRKIEQPEEPEFDENVLDPDYQSPVRYKVKYVGEKDLFTTICGILLVGLSVLFLVFLYQFVKEAEESGVLRWEPPVRSRNTTETVVFERYLYLEIEEE